jgi:hypothetical protein
MVLKFGRLTSNLKPALPDFIAVFYTKPLTLTGQ